MNERRRLFISFNVSGVPRRDLVWRQRSRFATFDVFGKALKQATELSREQR